MPRRRNSEVKRITPRGPQDSLVNRHKMEESKRESFNNNMGPIEPSTGALNYVHTEISNDNSNKIVSIHSIAGQCSLRCTRAAVSQR